MSLIKQVDFEEVVKGLEVEVSQDASKDIVVYVKGRYTDALGQVLCVVRRIPFFWSSDKDGYSKFYSMCNQGKVL